MFAFFKVGADALVLRFSKSHPKDAIFAGHIGMDIKCLEAVFSSSRPEHFVSAGTFCNEKLFYWFLEIQYII